MYNNLDISETRAYYMKPPGVFEKQQILCVQAMIDHGRLEVARAYALLEEGIDPRGRN